MSQQTFHGQKTKAEVCVSVASTLPLVDSRTKDDFATIEYTDKFITRSFVMVDLEKLCTTVVSNRHRDVSINLANPAERTP